MPSLNGGTHMPEAPQKALSRDEDAAECRNTSHPENPGDAIDLWRGAFSCYWTLIVIPTGVISTCAVAASPSTFSLKTV